MEKEKDYLLDVDEFANFIINYYRERHAKEITAIKLQKSLYFCFAYWGGFIEKGRKSKQDEYIELPSKLFNANFEAWSYGPVIPSIFHKFKRLELRDKMDLENFFGTNDILKETIISLLDDIFEISDFKLVNLSHADNSWKDNYDPDAEYHNIIIDNNKIINEYSLK